MMLNDTLTQGDKTMKIDIYLNAVWVATVGSFKLAAHLICNRSTGMNSWCKDANPNHYSTQKKEMVKARLRGEDVGVSIKIGDEIIWNSVNHERVDIGSQFWVIQSLDRMVENGIYYGRRDGQPSYTDWRESDTIDSRQQRDEESVENLLARRERLSEKLAQDLGRKPTLDETVDRMSKSMLSSYCV
jgi:hypothetical protein